MGKKQSEACGQITFSSPGKKQSEVRHPQVAFSRLGSLWVNCLPRFGQFAFSRPGKKQKEDLEAWPILLPMWRSCVFWPSCHLGKRHRKPVVQLQSQVCGPIPFAGPGKSNIETLWPSCFFPPLSKSRNGGDTGPIFPGCSRSSAAPVPFSRPGKKQSEVYGPSALCGVGKKQSEVCGQWLFPAFSSLEKQLRKKSLAWPLCHGFLWGRNLGPFLDLKIHQLRVQI